MTNFPTSDRIAESYARQVRHQLLAAEQDAADLAIADFEDALRAADSCQEQIAVCRRWSSFANDLKRNEEKGLV